MKRGSKAWHGNGKLKDCELSMYWFYTAAEAHRMTLDERLHTQHTSSGAGSDSDEGEVSRPKELVFSNHCNWEEVAIELQSTPLDTFKHHIQVRCYQCLAPCKSGSYYTLYAR